MSTPPTNPESPTPPENPTPSRRYSVFVSYSRRDDAGKWVTRLVEALRDAAKDDFEVRCDPGKEVFFDRDDLKLGEEWKTQLARAIREAEVLLVCVSKPYFESKFCLWEFQAHETKPKGPDDPSGIVPLLLEDTSRDDQPDEKHGRWHDRIYRMHGHDLRNVFTRLTVTAVPDELAAQALLLSDELYQQKQEFRRRDTVTGNLERGTSRFVGRSQELTKLGDALESPSTVGIVTAVRGLGGIGKTELVRHYGNQNQGHYAGGIWQIPSEGAKEMLPLLARLAPELLEFELPEDIRNNPELAGRSVLKELRRRTTSGHVLLILDNVSESALLTDPQLGVLPKDNSLHVAVTTRLGSEDFAGSTRLKQIHLQGLSIEESVSLLRAFQPDRDGDNSPDFRNEDDLAAARELAELLDGFTLAVEQAGVYLSTHPESTVRDYLTYLRSQNLTASDAMLEDREKTQIKHREKLLSVILDQSLTDLEQTLPSSLPVLRLAAAMPPDTIPWPWLKKLTQETIPEVFKPTPQHLKGRWLQIRRTLESRDLITEGKHTGLTGRMHRLIADHLRKQGTLETSLVDDFVIRRACELSKYSNKAPELWEVDTIMDTLPQTLTRNPKFLEQISDFIRKIALTYLTDTRTAVMLQDLTKQLTGTNTRASFLAHMLLGASLRNTKPKEAIANYEKSLTAIRSITEAQPDDSQNRRDLAFSLNFLGGMLCYTEPSRALGNYQESLDIRRSLAQNHPDDRRILRDLTSSMHSVANVLRNTDHEQALKLYQESLTIRRELAKQLPDNLQTQRDLTVALDRVAYMLRNTDHEQALKLYQESLTIRRELAKQLPDNLQTQRDLTLSLINVAGMLRDTEPGKSLERYQESLDIRRNLVEKLPGDLLALRDLAASLNGVAHVDPEQAPELYQESITITRDLNKQQPGNLQILWHLGESAAGLARLMPTENPEKFSLLEESAFSFREALSIQQEHQELGRLSYDSALSYADCDPDDRDEWLAYAAELAERFGFEEG